MALVSLTHFLHDFCPAIPLSECALPPEVVCEKGDLKIS